MEKYLGRYYFIIAVSFFVLIFLLFSVVGIEKMDLTGNIISDMGETVSVGDSLKGVVEFGLDLETIENDFPVIFLMTKDSSVVFVETLELSFVLENSELRDGRYFLNLEDLVDYSFDEAGDYEFLISILDVNFVFEKNFYVLN